MHPSPHSIPANLCHMPQTTSATDFAEIKAALRAEFPGWSIITTNRERWWATRNPVRDPMTNRLVHHNVTAVDADDADALREQLTKVDR